MVDLTPLLHNLRRYVDFSEAEAQQLAAITKATRFKKRQFLDQPGFVSNHRNYILQGAFRSYFIDDEGKDHTVQIAIEDWFVSDFYSYITRTPATLYVEALEDAVLLQMSYADVEGLCKDIHNLSEYFRITTEKAFAYSRMRALSNLSKSAEERYLEFAEMYPSIVRRVPQKIVASYLGMSPEFLSKIRSQLSKKGE